VGEIHSGTLPTTPELQGRSAGVVPSWVWMLAVTCKRMGTRSEVNNNHGFKQSPRRYALVVGHAFSNECASKMSIYHSMLHRGLETIFVCLLKPTSICNEGCENHLDTQPATMLQCDVHCQIGAMLATSAVN